MYVTTVYSFSSLTLKGPMTSIQQAIDATKSVADFIAIVTNISLLQGARVHVLAMDESVYP